MARETANSFVLWDLELTAWAGSVERNFQGFIPGTNEREHREVIQIAALRVVRTQDGLAPGPSLRLFVKPHLHPTLSQYIQQLTNISQAQIDNEGLSLHTAMNRWTRFINGSRGAGDEACVPLLSWGDDYHHFQTNAALQGFAIPTRTAALRRCTKDVRQVFEAVGIDPAGWHSGTIHRHPMIGAPTNGHVHDANFDVISVLTALQTLFRRGGRAARAVRAAIDPP